MSAAPSPLPASGFAVVGEHRLCYETFGQPGDPALLLVSGFGVQLTHWDPRLCDLLAATGLHVIRYDHRDSGLSTRLDGAADSDPDVEMAADHYGLDAMADDGIGLVRALGIEQVHVVGSSMGGMIAQLMALRHPGTVLSLCSIMSTTGAPDVGRPDPETLRALAAPAATDREAALDQAVRARHAVSGGRYAIDDRAVRARAAADLDRAQRPYGRRRHQLAVRAAGDRTEALRTLRLPTVVIHGEADPLVSVSGGRATAEAVPGAELILLPGVGHEIPSALHARLVEAIVDNIARAQGAVRNEVIPPIAHSRPAAGRTSV